MNILGRELKKGDKLVLSNGCEVVIGGDADTFGLHMYLSGKAVVVDVLNPDGTVLAHNVRIDGLLDINKEETEKRFAEANGWGRS